MSDTTTGTSAKDTITTIYLSMRKLNCCCGVIRVKLERGIFVYICTQQRHAITTTTERYLREKWDNKPHHTQKNLNSVYLFYRIFLIGRQWEARGCVANRRSCSWTQWQHGMYHELHCSLVIFKNSLVFVCASYSLLSRWLCFSTFISSLFVVSTSIIA